MKTQDVIEFYGTKAKAARALGIKPPSITDWGDTVPELRQYQIEKLTRGKLKIDPELKARAEKH